jgi:hypothetical protein
MLKIMKFKGGFTYRGKRIRYKMVQKGLYSLLYLRKGNGKFVYVFMRLYGNRMSDIRRDTRVFWDLL